MAFHSMSIWERRWPPIVIGLLVLLCFLLTCNWWSISTGNDGLLRQIDQLQEEIRRSQEGRGKCERQANEYRVRYEQAEEKITALHILQNELQENNDNLTESVELCNSEIDSMKEIDAMKNVTLEALRLDNDNITDQLNLEREESQKLQADLEETKIELSNLKRTYSIIAAQLVQDHAYNNSKGLTTFGLCYLLLIIFILRISNEIIV